MGIKQQTLKADAFEISIYYELSKLKFKKGMFLFSKYFKVMSCEYGSRFKYHQTCSNSYY